jgi:hypothetical protein
LREYISSEGGHSEYRDMRIVADNTDNQKAEGGLSENRHIRMVALILNSEDRQKVLINFVKTLKQNPIFGETVSLNQSHP